MLLRGNIYTTLIVLNVIFKCGREELIFNLFSALKRESVRSGFLAI
jgi:hypothetical protein